MKWIPALLLGGSALIALVYLVRATLAFRRDRGPRATKWKHYGYIVGLLLSHLSWICALAIFTMAELRWGDTLLVALFWTGVLASPIALVLAIVTSVQPGYFLAKCDAAQACFWVLLWLSLGRGV